MALQSNGGSMWSVLLIVCLQGPWMLCLVKLIVELPASAASAAVLQMLHDDTSLCEPWTVYIRITAVRCGIFVFI